MRGKISNLRGFLSVIDVELMNFMIASVIQIETRVVVLFSIQTTKCLTDLRSITFASVTLASAISTLVSVQCPLSMFHAGVILLKCKLGVIEKPQHQKMLVM